MQLWARKNSQREQKLIESNSKPPMPPADLLFMERTPERMIANGRALLALGKPFIPMRGRPVIDIGCGYGRMAYALQNAGLTSQYIGVDILGRHIRWLHDNFSPAAPNFRFIHFDAKNGRYNPNGSKNAMDFEMPQTPAPDAIFLLSVFTHMYEKEIGHYLARIAAAIDESSVVYATFFLINEEMRRLERTGKSQYPMTFKLNDHCYYFDNSDPLHAIAYDEQWLHEQLLDRNLRVLSTIYGKWAGRSNGLSGQDALFIAKAA